MIATRSLIGQIWLHYKLEEKRDWWKHSNDQNTAFKAQLDTFCVRINSRYWNYIIIFCVFTCSLQFRWSSFSLCSSPASETSLKYSTGTAGLDLQLQYSESWLLRFKVGVTRCCRGSENSAVIMSTQLWSSAVTPTPPWSLHALMVDPTHPGPVYSKQTEGRV